MHSSLVSVHCLEEAGSLQSVNCYFHTQYQLLVHQGGKESNPWTIIHICMEIHYTRWRNHKQRDCWHILTFSVTVMAMDKADKERRMLYFVTACTVLSILLMFIAMGTDYWVIIDIPGGVYRNETKSYLVNHHSGLWRICRTEVDNSSRPIIRRTWVISRL